MKKFDTVIFDLDGTLLNTLDDLADSVNYIMKQYGFPERSVAEVRSFVGNGVARLIERCIPDGKANPQFEECLTGYRRHYSDNMLNKTCPYEGIMDLLAQFSQDNFKLAIVSNKYDSAVKALNKIYFEKYIKVAIGESEAIAGKPAPDTVFKALEELGSAAERAVYVGDSEVDVLTAKNSGLVCAGVTWGFRDREALTGADFIIDKPLEILRIIK
jgi:phosphoglycolate phosphatase